MQGMFLYADSFNQDISKWNVSNVINMNNMFDNAKSFNQNINSWNVSKVETMENMFIDSPLKNNPPKWYQN